MEFLGILIVIALIGFVIYKIWDANEQVKFEKEQEQWLRAIIDKHPSSVPHPSTAHPKTTSTTPPTTTQRPASCVRRPVDPILTQSDISNYVNSLDSERAKEIVLLVAKYHRRMLSHITSTIVKNEDRETWAFLWGQINNYLPDLDILLSFDISDDIENFLHKSYRYPDFAYIRDHAEFYHDYFYFTNDNDEYPSARCLWIVPWGYHDGGQNLYNTINSDITMKAYAAYCDILINPHFSNEDNRDTIYNRYASATPQKHNDIDVLDFACNVGAILLNDIVSFCKELEKFQAKWSKTAQSNKNIHSTPTYAQPSHTPTLKVTSLDYDRQKITQIIGCSINSLTSIDNLAISTILIAEQLQADNPESFMCQSPLCCCDTTIFTLFVIRALCMSASTSREKSVWFNDNFVPKVMKGIHHQYANSVCQLDEMISNRISFYERVFASQGTIEQRLQKLFTEFEFIIKTDIINQKYVPFKENSPLPVLGIPDDFMCQAEVQSFHNALPNLMAPYYKDVLNQMR